MSAAQIDIGTDDLLARIDQGVAVITLNRPERRNALSPAMLDALAGVLRQVELDRAVGCVVLTGAGGAFCAGGEVMTRATRLANGPRITYAYMKENVNRGETGSWANVWTWRRPTTSARR